jgi:RNA polymerase sigma-70 factor (ECF subfamily)
MDSPAPHQFVLGMSPLGPTETAPLDLLRELYVAHLPYVARSLRRLGIADRYIEDVTHDVFVVVHRRLGDFDRQRPAKPWLFGIAFRVASDFTKRAQNRRELLVDPPTEPATSDDGLDARAAQDLVLRALDGLPPEQRAVFVLHELDGEPVVELARSLEIPLNTAHSRLRLARKRFIERVRELGGPVDA